MIAVAVGVKLSAQGTACRAIYVHLETQSMIAVEVFLKCIFRLSAYMIAVAVAVKSSQPKEQPAESSGEIKAAWSDFYNAPSSPCGTSSCGCFNSMGSSCCATMGLDSGPLCHAPSSPWDLFILRRCKVCSTRLYLANYRLRMTFASHT